MTKKDFQAWATLLTAAALARPVIEGRYDAQIELDYLIPEGSGKADEPSAHRAEWLAGQAATLAIALTHQFFPK